MTDDQVHYGELTYDSAFDQDLELLVTYPTLDPVPASEAELAALARARLVGADLAEILRSEELEQLVGADLPSAWDCLVTATTLAVSSTDCAETKSETDCAIAFADGLDWALACALDP